MTRDDLWAIYFPGKTPEQAYNEARDRHEEWWALYRAQRAVTATFHDCETEQDRADYWRRLAAAMAAIHRHAGVPAKWIDSHGRDTVPAGICRGCWQPGATDIDHCGGCEYHYHPACYLERQIRSDLVLAAGAQARGGTERAAQAEEMAAIKHEQRMAVRP